jgi:hypothetical protein
MSQLRSALRCNGLLDIKSFRTPPRLTAAPFTIVTNLTRCIGARQHTAMCRRPHRRGGVCTSKGTATPMSNATISGRERHCEVMRALRFALRCMVMLDLASLGPPPRSTSRAFNNRSECYSMRFGAATDCELLMASQARRRRTLKGKRTLMSNARHYRAAARHFNDA